MKLLQILASIFLSITRKFWPFFTFFKSPLIMSPSTTVASSQDDIVEPTASVQLTTQNVYGFADFTTTIGNTVMIFSPSSIAVAGKCAPPPTFVNGCVNFVCLRSWMACREVI